MMSLPYPYNKPMIKVSCSDKEFHLMLNDTITVEVALAEKRTGEFVNVDIDVSAVGSILDGKSPTGKKMVMEISYKFVDM
jgi:hypothetical protein